MGRTELPRTTSYALLALLGHATAIMTLRYMKYAREAVQQQTDVAKIVGSMRGQLGEPANVDDRAISFLPAHTRAHNGHSEPKAS